MKSNLQLHKLHPQYDKLQARYGAKECKAIYGAGCIKNPRFMFIFMNPTARNLASFPNWQGIRAPWIATKNIWDLFYRSNLIDKEIYQTIKAIKPQDWHPDFAETLYRQIAANRAYVTNLAKCTQIDARPLPNSVFKQYLTLIEQEIIEINPSAIITFGNQVSSILLNQNISVSNFLTNEQFVEFQITNKEYKVYPTYYPVGQGRRNLDKAIQRIKEIC